MANSRKQSDWKGKEEGTVVSVDVSSPPRVDVVTGLQALLIDPAIIQIRIHHRPMNSRLISFSLTGAKHNAAQKKAVSMTKWGWRTETTCWRKAPCPPIGFGGVAGGGGGGGGERERRRATARRKKSTGKSAPAGSREMTSVPSAHLNLLR